MERSKRANRGQNYARWAAEGQISEEQAVKKRKTESESQGEGQVRCSCGESTYNEEDARPMVECEKCYHWQHIVCATNGGDESQLSNPYNCYICAESASEQAGDEGYEDEDAEIAAIDEVDEEEEPLSKVRQLVVDSLVDNFTKQLVPMAQKEKLLAQDLDATNYSKTLAKEIEIALFQAHGEKGADVGTKYREKFRTLAFNLKNNKNHLLQTQIITKQVSPDAIAVLSAEQMLSPELRKLADQVKQESIQGSILKVDEGPRVRKTHKGEELVENEDQDLQTQPQPTQLQEQERAQPSSSTKSEGSDESGSNNAGGETRGPQEHVMATEAQYDTFDNYDEGDFSPLSPGSSDDDDDFAATICNAIDEPVWTGIIARKDVGDVTTKAFYLSGTNPSWTREDWSRVLPSTSRMQLEGKISAEVALPYVDRMSAVRVIAALALTSDDTVGYDTLCSHYQSRGKLGNIRDRSALAKDAYLFPLLRNTPLPPALKDAKAAIDSYRASNGNLLLALYVLPNADLLK